MGDVGAQYDRMQALTAARARIAALEAELLNRPSIEVAGEFVGMAMRAAGARIRALESALREVGCMRRNSAAWDCSAAHLCPICAALAGGGGDG